MNIYAILAITLIVLAMVIVALYIVSLSKSNTHTHQEELQEPIVEDTVEEKEEEDVKTEVIEVKTEVENTDGTRVGQTDDSEPIYKKPTKTRITRMREAELVEYARLLGIDAHVDDLKKDTLKKVLDKLGL